MAFIKPLIFEQFPELLFGFSTKIGNNRKPPYNFNMSLSVNDNEKSVIENRNSFFSSVGLNMQKVALQKQVHEDNISIIDKPGIAGESDAMITDKRNLGLAVSTGDCTPVFIYDKKNSVIAGVHSGWRSTEKKILKKTLKLLKSNYNSDAENLYVYIGPTISQKNYEVGPEVAEKFDEKYLKPVNGKFLLDVPKINYDLLIDFNIPEENIQLSSLCTFDNAKLLHSFRREGKQSGRALGVIAMK